MMKFLQLPASGFGRHLVDANLYLTGGIGPSKDNEGFTSDYDLPNETAYAETCASCGLIFWAHRMLHIDLDSSYSDVMERALYNGAISGVSLDGKKFFYVNPLASDGSHHRQEWFGCACCPPNIARLLASVGGYANSEGEEGIAIHLYIQGSAQFDACNSSIALECVTDYPWDGRVQLTVRIERPAEFEVRLRIPGWCSDYTISVNGEGMTPSIDRGYAVIRRMWSPNDTVYLMLAMPVQFIQANPKVVVNTGRVAIERGPIVYCFEEADNALDIDNICLRPRGAVETKYEPNLLGGVGVVECEGRILSEDNWGEDLYRPVNLDGKKVKLRAIPYATWDNRAPGKMAVWLPADWS